MGTLRPPDTPFTRAAPAHEPGIAREFLTFLAENKKWWLLPIVICLVGFALLIALSGSAVAPFIYTLF